MVQADAEQQAASINTSGTELAQTHVDARTRYSQGWQKVARKTGSMLRDQLVEACGGRAGISAVD